MTFWQALAAVGIAGLATLLSGLYASRLELEDEGEKRIVFGGGALAAVLLLAIGRACYQLGKLEGWWA